VRFTTSGGGRSRTADFYIANVHWAPTFTRSFGQKDRSQGCAQCIEGHRWDPEGSGRVLSSPGMESVLLAAALSLLGLAVNPAKHASRWIDRPTDDLATRPNTQLHHLFGAAGLPSAPGSPTASGSTDSRGQSGARPQGARVGRSVRRRQRRPSSRVDGDLWRRLL
jgi:hypothetical protein